MTGSDRPTVVVGVDGSDSSAAAVRWAEDYAQTTEASLRLVIAWHWPTSYGIPVSWEGFDPAGDARAVVDKAAAMLSLPAERVQTSVEQGAAGDVLVKASETADLLVVGCRGHGTLSGALLGSVSTHCAHHSRCSVVIVR